MKNRDVAFNFEGKTVVVVGGSRGIGLEVAKCFLESGADTYCISRNNPRVNNLKFRACDIEKEEQIKVVFDKFDKIDFLVNAAGTNLCRPIEEIDSAEWDRVMNTNLKSFYLICKEVIQIMKKNKYGRIINISSIAGRNKSIVSGVHYTSSKYGIIGLTKQLANEVSKHNILVNCVCPSQTKTEMLQKSMTKEEILDLEKSIPIRRIATTIEQALPILFLCSDAASYIAGAFIDVNGGQL